MAFPVFSQNGKILPVSQAAVSLTNVEYAYGFGVYETIRAVRGTAVFLEEHAERLMQSAKIIDLAHPFSKDEVTRWVNELLKVLGPEAVCNIKILLIGAPEASGAMLSILPLAPFFPDKKHFKTGASAITFSSERLFPQAKTLNMFGSYYAYRLAKRKGCYDALLLNHKGEVTEGTRTNVFGIKDRVIFSPPKKDILEGVTRMHVLQVAKEAGYELREEPLPLPKLLGLDGVFLTSTSTKILPLTRIDDHQFASVPEPLLELIKLFDAFLQTAREVSS
jgi:branched-chain amino acid aminotransferase